MIVSKEVFFSIQSKMDFISYDQSKGYHDFIGDKNIIYFTDNIENPTLCVWGVIDKKFKVLSILKISGESFKNSVTFKNYKEFYSQIIQKSSKQNFIEIINNNKYSVDFELGIRLAGFIRPMVFFSSPLSIMIDLYKEDIRSRQWRRQLKAANKNELRFIYKENPETEEIDIFVRMYNELFERKGLGGSISQTAINNLLLDKNYKLFFVLKNDQYLAGRIVYINNETSYDVYAANSDKALEFKGTTYFIMESIFDYLKTKGVKEFDFGRIGVGTRSSNSVYEFKSYSGGDIINYNSSWMYTKNKYIDTLLSVIRNFRSNRY